MGTSQSKSGLPEEQLNKEEDGNVSLTCDGTCSLDINHHGSEIDINHTMSSITTAAGGEEQLKAKVIVDGPQLNGLDISTEAAVGKDQITSLDDESYLEPNSGGEETHYDYRGFVGSWAETSFCGVSEFVRF